MGTIPPNQGGLRDRHGVLEQDLLAHINVLEQTLERLAEAVYHAQTYKDAPDEVKKALEAAQELLGL